VYKATYKIIARKKNVIIKCISPYPDGTFWGPKRDRDRVVDMVNSSVIHYPKKNRGRYVRQAYYRYYNCTIIRIGKWT
jgi:hypothetical protein